MGLTYFKRYRMELDLGRPLFTAPTLPEGYGLISWDDSLLEIHGDVKYECFCDEMDSIVFPCLGEREGCHRLMREIASREGFVPQSTWLMEWRGSGRKREYCGTVQGVQDHNGNGGIQNLGITPFHRGRGLGTVLLYAAACGFRDLGAKRVTLEVTAQNTGAVRLYQRLGFQRVKTVYKAADVAYA